MGHERTSAKTIIAHAGVLYATRIDFPTTEGGAHSITFEGQFELGGIVAGALALFEHTAASTVNVQVDDMSINCLRLGSVRVAIAMSAGAPIAKSRARMLRRFAAPRKTPANFKPDGVGVDLTDGCKIDGVEVPVADGSLNWTKS